MVFWMGWPEHTIRYVGTDSVCCNRNVCSVTHCTQVHVPGGRVHACGVAGFPQGQLDKGNEKSGLSLAWSPSALFGSVTPQCRAWRDE